VCFGLQLAVECGARELVVDERHVVADEHIILETAYPFRPGI
jgi:hypothetical protein